jgi:hypothetical protein
LPLAAPCPPTAKIAQFAQKNKAEFGSARVRDLDAFRNGDGTQSYEDKLTRRFRLHCGLVEIANHTPQFEIERFRTGLRMALADFSQ